MRICLFEDRRVADLAPLTLTRPAFDLLCGMTPVADKHARYFGPDVVGYLVRPLVADLVREGRPHAPVNDPVWLRSGPTVLVNARWVPPARPPGTPAPTTRELFAGGPFLAVCDGELAFAAVGPDLLAGLSPGTLDDGLDDWFSALPRHEVGGFVARVPRDFVKHSPAQIAADFPACVDPELVGFRPAGVGLVGPADRLFLDPSAHIDPMVVFDTTRGPVAVGPGAVVTAFSRLEGPCAVGAGSHVLGATLTGTSVGPHCRVGGTVEGSVLQGYADKAHDGFLGHSFVGEWVTLGANTQTADGGCVVGDHARTGLGVLIDGGAVVGPFAGLLPTGRLTPRDVPAFTRFGPDATAEALDFDALLAAADVAMRRRGRVLTRAHESVYRAVAAQTAAHRRRVLTGTEPGRQHRRAS